MMPGRPVSPIPPCKQNRHHGACLELFQAVGRFENSFIEAHQAPKMICNVRSLKSRMKTSSHLEEIMTSVNEVFNNFLLDMAIESMMLGIPT